jgi:hypothetical protein
MSSQAEAKLLFHTITIPLSPSALFCLGTVYIPDLGPLSYRVEASLSIHCCQISDRERFITDMSQYHFMSPNL